MSTDNKCIFIQEICHILLMERHQIHGLSIQSHRDRGFGVSQTHMGSLFSFDVAALISACEKPASDDMCEGSILDMELISAVCLLVVFLSLTHASVNAVVLEHTDISIFLQSILGVL